MLNRKELTIVHLSEAWDLPNGVVVMVKALARAQVAAGHRVTILVPSWRRRVPEQFDGVWVYFVPGIPLPGGTGYMLSLPWLSKTAQGVLDEADIVHTHHPFLLGLWASRSRKPVICTAHTNYTSYLHYAGIVGTLLRWQMVRYIGWFLNRCTAVVAPAPLAGVRLQVQYGVRRKPCVIWNGIDTARFEAGNGKDWCSELGVTSEMPVFIYVGRLAPEKRVDWVIRAIGLASPARLLVVGTGPQELYLKRLAKECNAEFRIHFLGALSHDELPNVLAAARCFISASESEVCPLTALEAQAAGLPVLVVDAPGASEVVRDKFTGKITPNKLDAFMQGAASLTLSMLEGPAFDRWYRKYAQRQARGFDLAMMAKDYLGLYASL